MKFGIKNSELGISLNRHPERSEGSSARFLLPLVVAAFAILAPASHAQQNVTVDAVKKRAELNSAKADLEEARRKRDMAVAARWKDRETFNKERELFNEKYQLGKERKRSTRNVNSSMKSISSARNA